MERLIKSRIAHENGDVEYTVDVGKITVNKHGDGLMRRVLDRLWEYEQGVVVAENAMTNADRIRAMSDEEMREFLCSITVCGICRWERWDGCGLREWLQQSEADTEVAEEG